MTITYSRRQFLARAISLALLSATQKAFASQPLASDTATGCSASDLETLAATMDEIIPAGGGVPPASMAGGPHYLEYLGWQYPAIQEEISRFLKLLAQASALAFQQDFRHLRSDQRVQARNGKNSSDKVFELRRLRLRVVLHKPKGPRFDFVFSLRSCYRR